jgi:hypothetical protein
MDREPQSSASREHDEDDNSLGYRNVDEQQEHDEQGTQGPGPGNVPPDEE